jgi:hypothetical protein
MFFRDKELGRTKGKDRESVLANAKLQREARLLQKQKDAHTSTVQKFCFGRLIARKKRALERADWDSKIADIQKLKVVLQRPNMPLPPDILHKVPSFQSREKLTMTNDFVAVMETIVLL